MRPAYAIEYDYVDPLSFRPPWRPSGSAGCIWPGRSTAPRATRRPRARGSGPGSTPPARSWAAPLSARPLPGLYGGAGGRPGDQGHPGALPAVHLPGRVPPAAPGGQRRRPPPGVGLRIGTGGPGGDGALPGKAAVDGRGRGAPYGPPPLSHACGQPGALARGTSPSKTPPLS